MTIRVAIIDDQEMIRLGLRAILETQDDIEVVGEAADGLAGVQLADELACDVLLMDIRMPGIDGVEAIRRIRRKHSPEALRIIILTTYGHDENVLNGLRVGANGFLGKGIGPDELADGIREVAAGGGALSAAAAAAVIAHVSEQRDVVPDPQIKRRFDELTAREKEMVQAAVDGLDNAQIAEQFFLSPLTVKTHVNRAMSKVGARDRAQLVTLAFHAGYRPER